MADEHSNGEAAPAKVVPGATAAGEFSSEFMADVFKKRGGAMPTAPETKTAEQLKQETDAQAAADEAKENEGKTPEEIKATADAKAEAAALKENEGKTPEEIKEAADAKAEAENAGEVEVGQDGETEEEAAESAKVVNARLKDLPEAQRKIAQAIIAERIGKVVGKAKAETERLEGRVVELTTELETTRRERGAQTVVPNVHSLMLVDTPEQIEAYADHLDAQEDVLEPLRETGVEADDAKGTAGFTPAQVNARLREIRKERERVLPQARTLLQKRTETAAALKAAYPALYNPTTEEYRLADALRKQLPELKRIPDADVFIAKIVLGTKVYTDLTKNPKGKTAVQAKPATTAKPATQVQVRKAPRAPGDGSSSLGSVLDDASRRAPDASGEIKKFTETRSRQDLTKAVSALVFRG